ncbi:MAG: hypothetical protein CMF49_03925 [Legionellales bacterium]|nr:hypothetical protein [Legionellales bacterium]
MFKAIENFSEQILSIDDSANTLLLLATEKRNTVAIQFILAQPKCDMNYMMKQNASDGDTALHTAFKCKTRNLI